MSQLTINDLNHYQLIFSEDAISGGKKIAIKVGTAAKVGVDYPGNVRAGYAVGLAVGIGEGANAYIFTSVR